MRAMILCAGLGTRLRPLTLRWPKPAIPLLGQPLLRYNLAMLRRGGVRQLGINTHHLPDAMRECAEAECARAGLPLTVVHEAVIQGTGGGIRGLRAFLDGGDFVVLNGDVLFAVDLAAAVSEHRRSGAAASMVLLPMPPGERYAAVEADARGRILRIAGHGPGGPALSPWHFSGVHVMSPRVFDFMSASGEEDINRAVYVRMMQAGLELRGIPADAYWSDLGTAARYLSCQTDLLSGRVPLTAFPGASPFEAEGARSRGAGIVEPSLVAASARLEPGARAGPAAYVGDRAVVGAGAHVRNAAVFEDTVVAPGELVSDALAWAEHRIPAR